MCAALELRKRGHEVTLYEASDALGGQLKHADYVSFKWPIARYKNYLITQLYKQGVRVLLHTKATPKMIAAAGYDAVIFAAGAVPKFPPVSVRDGANIWLPTDVYGHESELGPNVVVVGGSSTGVETGMHLAEKGHAVTVLTRSAMLAEDSNVVHYYDVMEEFWSKLEALQLDPSRRKPLRSMPMACIISTMTEMHSLSKQIVLSCAAAWNPHRRRPFPSTDVPNGLRSSVTVPAPEIL